MNTAPPSFKQHVWQIVAKIPAGRVATYGDVARQAGQPSAARAVGLALRQLPRDSQLPWHRVINAQGKLSLPKDSASHALQNQRLSAEGISLAQDKVLDFSRCRWNP